MCRGRAAAAVLCPLVAALTPPCLRRPPRRGRGGGGWGRGPGPQLQPDRGRGGGGAGGGAGRPRQPADALPPVSTGGDGGECWGYGKGKGGVDDEEGGGVAGGSSRQGHSRLLSSRRPWRVHDVLCGECVCGGHLM